MPIKKENKKKGQGKGPYVLRSPKTGKVLARGSKAYVTKRAGQIAYFRSH
jgi:hypothetical protein